MPDALEDRAVPPVPHLGVRAGLVFLRAILWLLTHTVYRLRITGAENVPADGGALVVCNHVSALDAEFLLAASPRFIRFMMLKQNYERLRYRWLYRLMRVIPIGAHLSTREMIHSLRAASDAIESGQVVGIFAEGRVTRLGTMMPFRRGLERIMRGRSQPIVPACLTGLWGSIFSFERGRFVWKMPHRVPYPVMVSFGKPLPATATSFEVRQAVQALATDAFTSQRSEMLPLGRAFIRTARRKPLRMAMADATVPRLRFAGALARAVFLARRLRSVWREQQNVGILLPPTVGGALVNLAAALMGKTAINLNYTISNEALASCVRQCDLRSVVTSRALLERLKVELPVPPVLIEDLVAQPRFGERLAAGLMALLVPAATLERWIEGRAAALDDVAAIIFSSGSTGDPKGVMLTHYNVASNVRQLADVFMLGPKDRIAGILPFFHSFGFTATIWLPAIAGIGAVYHASPLEAKAIGDSVRQYGVTLLVSAPTFLHGFLRHCASEDLGTIKYLVVGAEKLPAKLADEFEKRFGIRLLEGYGCTECAPVVAVNTGDFRGQDVVQLGARQGSVGRPLPGISVRIVDPETGEQLGPNRAGLLLVRGPNVMLGYLGRPEKTAEVLRDGWYNTGDIAVLDDDGFLTIADRLSRFSKIGGEMVPQMKVEEKLQELAGETNLCFAVTGVPDEKKGERLVVLHTLSEAELQRCQQRLAEAELPALWKPRPNQFFHIDGLPTLATGKLDLRRVRELALELSKAVERAAAGA